jgi:Tol biopolymer transport system component
MCRTSIGSLPGASASCFCTISNRVTIDRSLTLPKIKGTSFVGDGGAFSPDDTEFAYSWFNGNFLELRIVGLQASGIARSRILFSNPEVPRIWPQDWSSDGKWLGVQLQRKDRTAQIGLVAAQDGSIRVLKSVDWRGSSKLFFSPDSRYVAFDLPTSGSRGQRDLFVLALDGSREIPAVVHPADDALIGWSPDGRYLLFTSDRTGATGLWSLAFTDGQPQGAPEQVMVDVAGASMGLTNRGTLYVYLHHPSFSTIRSDIQVAAFDFGQGRFLSLPAVAVQAFVGANNFPAWSPDGKSLAFLSRRGERARGSLRTVIGFLSADTGRLRELDPQLNIYVGGTGVRWSPDGRSLAIQATDSQGRQGIFRIDAETGEATPLALSSRGVGDGGSLANPMWAPDGKTLYYQRVDPSGPAAVIVERDLSSGNERDLFRKSLGPAWNPHWMFVDLSPDGQFLAAVANQAWPGHNTGKWHVVLIPVSGGEPRELMHGESQGAGVLTWAPDSRSILVYSIEDQSAWDRELWRVAIDGTEPRKLGAKVSLLGPPFNSDQQVHAHPDGRRVAFAAAEPAKPDEVWALENFLPANGTRGDARQRGTRGERR